jgi:hypothetical protein
VLAPSKWVDVPMSGFTGVFVKSETNAVVSAVPALGPSLPILPSGMYTCTSRSFRNVSCKFTVMPSSNAWLLTHESAICALSRMTSPSLPVSWRPPFPGMLCGRISIVVHTPSGTGKILHDQKIQRTCEKTSNSHEIKRLVEAGRERDETRGTASIP